MELDNFNVTLNGKKYDIQRFLRDHPGGTKTLEHFKNKSIENGMLKFDHSLSAYYLLNDFKINGNDDENNSEHNNNIDICDANENRRRNVNGDGVIGVNGMYRTVTNGVIKNDSYHNEISEFVDSKLNGAVSASGRIVTKNELNKTLKEIAFLEELEGRLDWSKPILSQLHKVQSHYEEWVNMPVYKQMRLFHYTFLEFFTYTPWYLVPVYWLPIILYLLQWQIKALVLCEGSSPSTLTVPEFVLHVGAGVLVWTLVEYSLHRWLFHMSPGDNLTMIRLHFLMHGIHHKVPFDSLRQVMPLLPATVIACILYTPAHFVFTHPLVELTGGIIGYVTYDMIHWYVHRGSPTPGSYLYAMKRYHSNHHFVNHDKGFGISSKLWDHVFNTVASLRKLDIGLKWK